jgi:uncharacterized RDD family membrane protein YckC
MMEQPATLKYAPIWKRLLALVIDYLLVNFVLSFIIALVVIVGWAGEGPTMVERGDDLVRNLSESQGWAQWLVLFGFWLYFSLMHSSAWGATVGKRTLGLYVADAEGQRISFIQATLRFMLMLLLFLGFLVALFHPKRQALHDIIAKTYVMEW